MPSPGALSRAVPVLTEGETAQYAALCYRFVRGEVRVLLITSRDTGRWILPKGWPIVGLSPAETAAREAFEEAGVRGCVAPDSVGQYRYVKLLSPEAGVLCNVSVFAMRVDRIMRRYPESTQRRRKWFSPAKAAVAISEPDLKQLLAGFLPSGITPDACVGLAAGGQVLDTPMPRRKRKAVSADGT